MESKNIILLICVVLSFFTVFAFNAVMIAVPSIATEFAMDNIAQNWVTIIFLLTLAALSVPAGQICGKYGLKKLTIISIILFNNFNSKCICYNHRTVFTLPFNNGHFHSILKCNFNGNGRISI